nr:MAG TPA: hypothetical protein [Caudoviricetes sp.]
MHPGTPEISEHRALDARGVVESLRACEDKQCKSS